MLTLLVLIHKSADELSAAKKEIGLCKQQYDSLYSQLQNAIEYKLRLEKTLQNEKADNKQKIEDVQVLLSQEKEERRKEKEEAENRYEALNQKYRFRESENKDANENVQSLQKLINQKDEEISALNKQLSSLRSEKEQLIAQKDEKISDLEVRLKNGNKDKSVGALPNKSTSETIDKAPGLLQPEAQPGNPNASTPNINPEALQAEADQNQRAALQPPQPPPPQENSALQNQMRQDLNAPLSEERKPEDKEESVINSPDKQSDDGKLSANAAENGNNGAVGPPPNFEQDNKKPEPSVASNNIGEAPQIDEGNRNLPAPKKTAHEKIIPRQMNNNYNADYKDNFGEEDGEEGEYMENDIGKGQAIPKRDYKQFDDMINNRGESVMIHPK